MTLQIRGDASQLVREFDRAEQSARSFSDRVVAEARQAGEAFDRIGTNARQSANETTAAGQQMSGAFAGAEGMVRDLNAGMDRFGREARDASRRATAGMDRFNRELRETQTGITSINLSFRTLAGTVAAGFGISELFQGLRQGFNTFTDLQGQIAGIQGVLGETNEGMVVFRDTITQLGRDTAFAGGEIAGAFRFMSQAGVEANDQLRLMPELISFARAGQLQLADSADLITNVMAGFNLRVEDSNQLMNTLVNTANSSNTSITQLAQAARFVAPVMSAVGVSAEEASAAIGVLGNSGIQATMAGTQLRAITAALISPTRAAQSALESYGLTQQDVDISSRGLTAVFRTLEEANVRQADAVQLVGREALSAFNVLARGVDTVDALTMANERSAGTMERQVEIIDGSFEGSVTRFSSSLENLGIVFFESIEEPLGRIIEASTVFLNLLADNIDVVTNFGIALGTLTLTSVTLSGIRNVGTFIGGIGSAARRSRTQVQGLRSDLDDLGNRRRRADTEEAADLSVPGLSGVDVFAGAAAGGFIGEIGGAAASSETLRGNIANIGRTLARIVVPNLARIGAILTIPGIAITLASFENIFQESSIAGVRTLGDSIEGLRQSIGQLVDITLPDFINFGAIFNSIGDLLEGFISVMAGGLGRLINGFTRLVDVVQANIRALPAAILNVFPANVQSVIGPTLIGQERFDRLSAQVDLTNRAELGRIRELGAAQRDVIGLQSDLRTATINRDTVIDINRAAEEGNFAEQAIAAQFGRGRTVEELTQIGIRAAEEGEGVSLSGILGAPARAVIGTFAQQAFDRERVLEPLNQRIAVLEQGLILANERLAVAEAIPPSETTSIGALAVAENRFSDFTFGEGDDEITDLNFDQLQRLIDLRNRRAPQRGPAGQALGSFVIPGPFAREREPIPRPLVPPSQLVTQREAREELQRILSGDFTPAGPSFISATGTVGPAGQRIPQETPQVILEARERTNEAVAEDVAESYLTIAESILGRLTGPAGGPASITRTELLADIRARRAGGLSAGRLGGPAGRTLDPRSPTSFEPTIPLLELDRLGGPAGRTFDPRPPQSYVSATAEDEVTITLRLPRLTGPAGQVIGARTPRGFVSEADVPVDFPSLNLGRLGGPAGQTLDPRSPLAFQPSVFDFDTLNLGRLGGPAGRTLDPRTPLGYVSEVTQDRVVIELDLPRLTGPAGQVLGARPPRGFEAVVPVELDLDRLGGPAGQILGAQAPLRYRRARLEELARIEEASTRTGGARGRTRGRTPAQIEAERIARIRGGFEQDIANRFEDIGLSAREEEIEGPLRSLRQQGVTLTEQETEGYRNQLLVLRRIEEVQSTILGTTEESIRTLSDGIESFVGGDRTALRFGELGRSLGQTFVSSFLDRANEFLSENFDTLLSRLTGQGEETSGFSGFLRSLFTAGSGATANAQTGYSGILGGRRGRGSDRELLITSGGDRIAYSPGERIDITPEGRAGPGGMSFNPTIVIGDIPSGQSVAAMAKAAIREELANITRSTNATNLQQNRRRGIRR